MPGLNLQSTLSSLNGKWSRLYRLLQNFAEEFGHALPEMAAQLNRKDFETAGALLHTLKGAAGMLGAHRLHVAAQAVEGEVKAGHAPPPSWGEFEEAMTELLEGIQSLEAPRGPEKETNVIK